jgi:hypothetical protein
LFPKVLHICHDDYGAPESRVTTLETMPAIKARSPVPFYADLGTIGEH